MNCRTPKALKFCLSFLMIMVTTCLSGLTQVHQQSRIEIDNTDDYKVERLFNFKEKGFIVSKVPNGERKRGEPDRIFCRYDTNLKEVARYELHTPFKQSHYRYEIRGDYLYTFYFRRVSNEFTLVSLSADSLTERRIEGKLDKGTYYINEMFGSDDYTILKANFKNEEILYILNNYTGKRERVQLSDNSRKKKYELLAYQPIGNMGKSIIFYRIYGSHEYPYGSALFLVDHKGKISELEFFTGDYTITRGSVSELSDGTIFISGTCSSKEKGYGKCMFVTSFRDGKQQYFKAYPFAEFENFMGFVYGRYKKSKYSEQKLSEKKSLNYPYELIMNKPVEMDSNLVVIGEAYYKKVAQGSHGYSYITGYQYTHATIVTLNYQGDKLQDNTFKMYIKGKPIRPKTFIQVNKDGNRLKLVYADEKHFKSRIFENGELVQDEKSEEIQTGSEDDRIIKAEGNLEPWYGDYYISYGHHKIKNPTNKKKKRSVFYVQKITY